MKLSKLNFILENIASFLTYWIGIAYLIIVYINFIYPINQIASIIIIFFTSYFSLVINKNNNLFSSLKLQKVKNDYCFNTIFMFFFFTFLIIWPIVAITHPSIDTDTHVYHLPYSLIMNKSVWYPGIVKINLNFGSPNGASVISSVFTSFNIIGFENITNILIWLAILFTIISIFSINLSSFILSLIVASTVLLQPDIFWQSYNMGEDLGPCLCIGLGLYAWNEKKLKSAIYLLGLASIFRMFGLVLFGLLVIFEFGPKFANKRVDFKDFLSIKVILGFGIVISCLVRSFIGSGNFFFPYLPLSIGEWSIPTNVQVNFVELIKNYSGVVKTISNIPSFIANLLFFPKSIKGSYFFWPPILTSLIIYFSHNSPHKYKINFKLVFSFILVFFIWYYGSPLTRFFLGPMFFLLLFSTKLFINLKETVNNMLIKNGIIYCSYLLTFLAFSYNGFRHIKQDVMPLLPGGNIERKYMSFMSYTNNDIKKIMIGNKFKFNQSNTTYCGRSEQPCFNTYSVGNTEQLFKNFQDNNKRIQF